MFDFWKEVIINDADRLKSLTEVYAGTAFDGKKKGIRVTRCADYEAQHLLGGVVYKTLPVAGECATIDFSKLISGTEARRAQIVLGLEAGQDSEFAQPWSNFKKTINVEFTDATSFKAAFKLACENHIATIKVVKSKELIVLKDPRVRVDEIILEKIEGDSYDVIEADKTAVTPNKLPFGTGEWILENLRFPTHVNTRVASPNSDDMPIAGQKYVQYAFEYAVPKRGFHGQGTVGQAVTSVTHHIFYVLESIDADDIFKQLLGDGGELITINGTIAGANDEAFYSTALDKDVELNGTTKTADGVDPEGPVID